jgi:LPXTG-motif cell wall-anchored protein
VVRKISLALALVAMAGVASATPSNQNNLQFLWLDFCPATAKVTVRAPEIDPASAMAGLTMLAGGLAVLRGRRRKNTEE